MRRCSPFARRRVESGSSVAQKYVDAQRGEDQQNVVEEKAYGVTWNKAIQTANLKAIVAAQKASLFETPKPRFFVYQYCRFLDGQREAPRAISEEQANDFVNNNEPPSEGDGE